MPALILQLWFLGLLSAAMVAGTIYFGREWYLRSWVYDLALQRSVFDPGFGWNEQTALFAGAVALVLVILFGGSLVKAALRLGKRSGSGNGHDPRRIHATPAGQEIIRRPDGTHLHVEFYGSPDSPPLILTHGWGLHGSAWNYVKADLAQHFRLIIWDEPGLGRSTQPRDRDFRIEKMAADLDAVLNLAGSRPALLVGHSIGGMIILTFCRLFRETLARRVSGVVLTHSTYTNPLRTTKGAAFFCAIQNPILKPLMWLTVALSPLVRLMTWLSYRNGTLHLATKRSSFAGTETWAELDFATRFTVQACPAVLARGMLGMLQFDETETLKELPLPALIVAANEDTTTLPEASDRMRADIPRARMVTLAPGRHLGFLEQRSEYAESVRGFSDSLRANIPKADDARAA